MSYLDYGYDDLLQRPINDYQPSLEEKVAVLTQEYVDANFADGAFDNKIKKLEVEKLTFTPYIIGTDNLDDITNGTTYAKVLSTDISAGHILMTAVVGDLDDISDGSSYGKIALTDISSGHITVVGSTASININNTTFGQDGIQLQYNAGNPRAYIGDGANQYFNYDGTKITWKAANSALDASGNLSATSVNLTGALTTGVGSSIDGQYLGAGTVASAAANLALRGWTFAGTFSATDYRVVAWTGANFVASDGTTYAITGANTGNMAVLTYIYLDIAVSTTAFQITTTAATAIGNGKVLIAVASNNSDTTSKASYQVFGGTGGERVFVDNISANSASTNEFVSNSAQLANLVVTDAKINTLGVNKLTAGTITSKTINLAIAAGTGDTFIAAGKTDFGQDATSGFILGLDDSDSDKAKFEIGSSATKVMKYDGTDWSLIGGTITSGTIQTATGTGTRVIMSGVDNKVSLYDSSNKERLKIATDGLYFDGGADVPVFGASLTAAINGTRTDLAIGGYTVTVGNFSAADCAAKLSIYSGAAVIGVSGDIVNGHPAYITTSGNITFTPGSAKEVKIATGTFKFKDAGQDRSFTIPFHVLDASLPNDNQIAESYGMFGMIATASADNVGGSALLPADFLAGTTITILMWYTAADTNARSVIASVNCVASGTTDAWEIQSAATINHTPTAANTTYSVQLYSGINAAFVAGRLLTVGIQANDADITRIRAITVNYKAAY